LQNATLGGAACASRRPRRHSNGLFDRDSQSSDQPRDFVELLVIVIPDGPCEPGKAFIVAHRPQIAWDDRAWNNRAWNNRRYRAIGVKDGHQITSRIEPAKPAWFRIKTFWRPVGDMIRLPAPPGATPERRFAWQKGRKTAVIQDFLRGVDITPDRPICRFASLKAFVIRCPLRRRFRSIPR
jgi:hypothetical protein